MRVEVTKKDIKEGVQQDCRTCAVAKALCRLPFPKGTDRLLVDHGYVLYDRTDYPWDGPKIRVPVKREVTNYIKRFDKNKKYVQPTVFNIDIPV
jgi:hypothetical protein